MIGCKASQKSSDQSIYWETASVILQRVSVSFLEKFAHFEQLTQVEDRYYLTLANSIFGIAVRHDHSNCVALQSIPLKVSSEYNNSLEVLI